MVRLAQLIRPLEHLEVLDRPSDWLSSRINTVVRPAKSLLSGTWLGHPLHPVLTDVVIGAWGSGIVLDLVGGENAEDAADTLIGFGVLSFFPTAIAGWSDWADTSGPERRVGLIHAIANGSAMTLFAGSWLARRSGHRGRGRVLALVAGAEMTAGAYLGGHLVSRGVGVDHTAFEQPAGNWTNAASASKLVEGSALGVKVGGVAVLLYQRGREILAISDTCTHAGGPLHEGEIDEELCVTCPWHGSRFRLRDGAAVGGPASADQVSYETRMHAEQVQIRRRR